LAPSDETHTHTATVGATRLSAGTSLELVLVQPADARQPMLDMHVLAPSGRLSINITGTKIRLEFQLFEFLELYKY
jgi:hypothetical protein